MDFLAFLFFIGFMILRALAESKRKQQAGQRRPPERPARPVEELPPPWGRQKPQGPDRERPPVFPLPLPWELEEEEEEREQEFVFYPTKADQAREKAVPPIVEVDPEEQAASDWRRKVLEETPAPAGVTPLAFPRFSSEDWTRGIVMAEILQPPRARRRTGYPTSRRKFF
ncbi:MAG: hypothetical protein ACOY9Y_07205 [Bacillota bacterium]